MEAFNIENLSFVYPGQMEKALDNISLTINAGDFILLCGETGCGKTTFLKMLKREITPHGETKGRIFYNGIELSNLDEKTSACKIGFVMQKPDSQIVTDMVWHELAFGLENIGLPTQAIRSRVAETASYFGINEWFRKKTCELSGGQKQLLNLASIMAMQPDVLILDEPTSQLDPISASKFIDTIKELNNDFGITVVVAEHNLEKIFSFADNVVFMEKGKIIYYNTPYDIGKSMDKYRNSKLFESLPSSIRIFSEFGVNAPLPITVNEGRRFLSEHFSNEINMLETKEYKHDSHVAIELKDVWFRYEKNSPDIMQGVNFKVYKEEIYSILGGNGTGKTTMLNVISGTLKAYRGKIKVNDKSINQYKGNELYKNNLVCLPQKPETLFLKSSVLNDFTDICKVMNYNKSETDELIAKTSDILGISSILEKHPYDLSGGEIQKAALAKILLLKPKILLLDEPTKGIDSFSKHEFVKILRNLKQNGAAIIIATHDIEFAAEISDRCGLFFNGEVISSDIPVNFFTANKYYTTAANRIVNHMYNNIITCEDAVRICKMNLKNKI